MVSIPALWLPILLASVFVFITSSVIHMALTAWHKNDFRALPDEDAGLSAIGSLGLEPGDYLFPHTGGASEVMRSEEFQNKVKSGPIGMLTIMSPSAWLNMGPQLAQWFAYTLAVSVVAAYVAGVSLGPGADYLTVFQITGTVAFACYAMSLPQRSIWWHQSWGATTRTMIDGLVYACVTAGAFGWLWPV